MCESTVYIRNGGRMEPCFEHLDIIVVEGGTLKMTNLFGETETIRGRVSRLSLVDHKVIVERGPEEAFGL